MKANQQANLYRFYKPAIPMPGNRSHRFAWEQAVTSPLPFATDAEANQHAKWIYGPKAFAERQE